MPKITPRTAQKILDLVPSTTYGMDKDLDQFLQEIRTGLDDAVTAVSTGKKTRATLTITISK